MACRSALAAKTTALGVVSGFFPIGWIILNVIFLYRLTVDKGLFAIFQHSMGSVTADRRLQLLLIAFCFGAFFEGAAGFGTPVAVTAAMLMGLGFSPLAAAGLSLIADTATVAFGALGTPIQALATSTGMSPFVLGQIMGRQSSVFALIIPFWLIWAFVGWKKMWEVWPAILVAALGFAIPQYIISNYINPWIVDIVAGGCAMACLVLFLRVWQPKEIWTSTKIWGRDDASTGTGAVSAAAQSPHRPRSLCRLGAVDHPVRRAGTVGDRSVEEPGQSAVLAYLSCAGDGQADPPHAAHRAQAHQ